MHVTISAIIPAYNAQAFIQETIDSLLRQTRQADEIIIVDDGSTDDTAKLAENAAARHPVIRVIRQENKGVARARLAGYESAQYDFLYFIDADDVAMPEALEQLSAAVQKHPDAVACYGKAQIVDSALNPFSAPRSGDYPSGNILILQLRQNHIIMGSILLRKSALHREAMDHTLTIGQDLVMWAQLAAAGPFQFIGGEPVLLYRKHEQNTTRRHLEDTSRYFAYIDWIFSYQPITDKLTPAQITRLRRRRTAATHSFIAKTALMTHEYALSRRHASHAMQTEPFNLKLYALWFFARLTRLPDFVKARLFS